MPEPFEHAIVRVVPDVAREEFINAGVVYFCEADRHLDARIELDEARLLALAPHADLDLVRRHLVALIAICRGGDEAGPIGRLPPRERWRWIVAPRSTILQFSPPHPGMTNDPQALLDHILERFVRTPTPPTR